MSRRAHYSASLTQALGIFPECLALFEIWEPGMEPEELFAKVQSTNALNMESERRLRNIVIEGFCSRFLREPYIEAAPSLKVLFTQSRDNKLLKQITLLYALRQHGILFDFLSDEYWSAVRSGGQTMMPDDVQRLIDRGLVKGRLEKDWSASVRKRVSSYVLGIAADFDLLGKPAAGARPILPWALHDDLTLYLAHDLHFLGSSDDEVAAAEEWSALGLRREDVTLYLNRLQDRGHLTVQDTGFLCRIDWKYESRQELIHVLLS